jgi:hypothetical protein
MKPMAEDTLRALAVFRARARELLDADDVAEDTRLPLTRAQRAIHNLSRRSRITHVGGSFFTLTKEEP